MGRGGNKADRVGLGWVKNGSAKTGSDQNLTAQPVLKIGLIGPNSPFKIKKIRTGRVGPSHTGLDHTGPDQIWPGFFRANNLMTQFDPNFGWTGLTHRIGPILSPLGVGQISVRLALRFTMVPLVST